MDSRGQADISLRNYTKWRSLYETTLLDHLKRGQHDHLAKRATEVVKSFLAKDNPHFKCFDVIERIIQALSKSNAAGHPWPVAYGTYVIAGDTLRVIADVSPGPEHARWLYSVLPTTKGDNDDAFDGLLKSIGLSHRITPFFGRPGRRTLPEANWQNASRAGQSTKRPSDPWGKPPAKRAATSATKDLDRLTPPSKDAAPSESFVDSFSKKMKEEVAEKARLKERVADLDKKAADLEVTKGGLVKKVSLLEREKKALDIEKTSLAEKVSRLEDKVRERDAAIEVWKNISRSHVSGTSTTRLAAGASQLVEKQIKQLQEFKAKFLPPGAGMENDLERGEVQDAGIQGWTAWVKREDS